MVGDGSADGRLDGRGQDSRLDGGPGSDARIEAAISDVRIEAGIADARPEVGPAEVRVADVAPEVRAEAGGPDIGRDVASAEGVGRPDVARPEAGRPEVPPPPIDGPRDTLLDAAPTLTSIEISPPNPSLATGTSLPVVITAVYSDGSTRDVSSSATVTSSDTSILTVSGATLTGVKAGTATITATYQGKTATATVTVGDSPLVSISIASVPPIAIGGTANLVATGVFANGSKQDVTSQATWTSSSAAIATVGDTGAGKGLVTGVGEGTVTVTATLRTISGTVQVSVVAKKITSIGITPAQPILQRGVTQAFKATAVYDDNSTGDVTQQVTWSTADAGVLTVVATGANAGLATAQGAGSTTITATVGGVSGQTSVRVTVPTLTSITVSPATAAMIVGGTKLFTAQGSYSDGTTADLTDSVTWSSSSTTVLSLSNTTGTRGQATALAAGSANVQATFQGITGTAVVTVTAPTLVSIAVTPNPLTLPQNLTLSLKATATYADQTTQDVTASATWTVIDSKIATVGNVGTAAGQVTGVAIGSTTVTATLSGISGSATVNVIAPALVSITVTPATATISAGDTQAFTATGTYQGSSVGVDITTQVTWSSSNIAVAQVSNAAGSNGVATGLTSPARGNTVTITAALNGVQGTATLTVTAPVLVAIMVRPATATINVRATQDYTVRGVYANGTTGPLTGVSWESSLTGVATIAAGGGGGGGGGGATATGVGPGTTTITATYTTAGGVSLSDTATLTVNAVVTRTPIGIRLLPASATIQVNGTQPYTVNVDYNDGTTAPVAGGVTLTTSDGGVAAVAGGGRAGGGMTVNGIAAGTVTVTATYATGGQTFTDTATLTVTSTPPPSQVGLYITPATASVQVNGTQQFQAHATFSDGTETVVTNNAGCSWTTSDGTLATVTTPGGRGGFGGGLATGVAAGSVTINVTYGGFSAKATLTVTPLPALKSLVILPAAATIHVGQDQPFTATAFYSDGTSALVTAAATWNSSDAAVAVMSVAGGGRGGFPGGGVVGGGTATGLAVGTATISATYTENGVAVTGTAVLTVTDPPLLSLEITPTNPTVSLLSPNQAFVATAIFTDFSTRNVTAAASWSSLNGAVAVISNSGGTIGRATGLTGGSSMITATYGGMSASTSLTVVLKKVTTIQVTPTNPTAVLGINQPFVATAVYDDSTTGTVTGGSTWTSSDPTVASVGTAGGTAGVATPIKAGTTSITATYQGVPGTTVLTVSSAKLTSIAITPSPLSVPVGGHQQLTATGTWGGDAGVITLDITNNVTWLSSSDAVGTVSNAAGSRGLFTAVSAGSVTITAAFQGVTGTLAGTVAASH